jgi:hypothetical protein
MTFSTLSPRNDKREVLGVNDTLDKIEVFGDDVLSVVHDEDMMNLQLDVVALLLGLEEVKQRTGNKTSVARERKRKKRC